MRWFKKPAWYITI